MYVVPALLLFLVFPVPGLPAFGQDDHMVMNVESEYDFIQEMVPHHQEAVDSSLVLAERTSRKELADFADNIVRVQRAEIELMQLWHSTWYPERSGVPAYQPMMRSTSKLSADQADERYLRDMIKHHQMAVMMAESLLSGGFSVRPEVKEFAQGIITTQNSEIKQMKKWLDEILEEKQENMKGSKPDSTGADATSGASS